MLLDAALRMDPARKPPCPRPPRRGGIALPRGRKSITYAAMRETITALLELDDARPAPPPIATHRRLQSLVQWASHVRDELTDELKMLL